MDEASILPAGPPQQLLIRSSTGNIQDRVCTAQFRTGNLLEPDLKDQESNPTNETGKNYEPFARYSKDGRFLAVINEDVVNIYLSEEETICQTIEAPLVDEVQFSPDGSFLITFQYHKMKEQKETVSIWDVKAAKVIREFHCTDRSLWPILSWSDDGEILSQKVTNQINFYDGKNPTKNIGKLHIKGVESYKVSEQAHAVACFVPDRKSQPAQAMIYEINKDGDDFSVSEKPTAAKAFFRAQTAVLEWSPIGNAVLITARTDVDKTGESYYGESQLHLLYTDGQCLNVPFGTNKGPVFDAKWSPQGKDFVVIQGFQPAKILLFNAANCNPVRDFGNASRNTIIFSPHGRFICIGGFGNLAGEMDFWEKNKFKKMGTCQDIHGASSFEWTPDGRNFITSALFPRRKVDEGLKVWTYYGELVYAQKLPKLHQVAIRPSVLGVYPNRPMSPRLSDKKLGKELAQRMEAAKPKAYVPPFLRGKGSGAGSGVVKAAKAESGGGSAPRKLCQLAQQVDPEIAAAAAAAKAEKNKKRRDRLKAKKSGEEEAAEKAEEEKKRLAAEKKATEESEKAAKLASGDPATLQKALKKLQKQERQVLKLKEQSESGGALDAGQQAKLTGFDKLKQEIAALQEQLAAL